MLFDDIEKLHIKAARLLDNVNDNYPVLAVQMFEITTKRTDHRLAYYFEPAESK